MTEINSITKICCKCKSRIQIHNLTKDLSKKDNLSIICSPCAKLKSSRYAKTKKGLILSIYGSQKANSKRRNHNSPSYSLNELREWATNQSVFHDLFDDWVASGHKKALRPSFDRIDDYQGYSLDGIKIMTWEENKAKADFDIKNGINTKKSKAVEQLTLDGSFVKRHHSVNQAERDTGIYAANISSCCVGKRDTAGKFRWMHA